MALTDVMKLGCKVEAASILRMTAIDDVACRSSVAFRVRQQGDPAHAFTIDHRDLFAGAQILESLCPIGSRSPIGDAAASTAAVETEHQPWAFGCAAMDVGKHAKRPVRPDQPSRHLLDENEAGTPHERAISEDP